jgi:CheY-like chemotaxis protein
MKKIRILIVEDEAMIAQCMKMELEANGYEVCNFVSTGIEAIQEFKKHKPDLVLMDVNLPGEIDGIEAAKEILSNKNVPLILMTGYNEANILDRSKTINAVAYLEKPIEIYDLKPIIDAIFAEEQ